MKFDHVAQLELPIAARKCDRWDVDVTVDVEENTVDLDVTRSAGEGAYVSLPRADAVALRDALTQAIERLLR